MKANELTIGQKYIWRRNSEVSHEVIYLGTYEMSSCVVYDFEYKANGETKVTVLCEAHIERYIQVLPTNTNNLTQYIAEFKNNPCIATYSNLYNCGIYMYMLVSNAWQRVTTYKSDFSDIEVGGGLYNSPDINDVSGVWVLRRF